MLPFGVWASLTSLWSYYPIVSLTRGGYYLFLVTGLLSVTIALRKNRISLFQLLFGLNLVIVAVAVFSIATKVPADSWSGGNAKGLMGFFAHQNSLGASLHFTFPGWLYIFVRKQNREETSVVPGKETKKKTSGLLFLMTGIFVNLLLITLTYSRASLISFFLMLLLFGLFMVRGSFLVKSLVLSGTIALFLALPMIANQFELLQWKQSEEFGMSEFWIKQGDSFISTREQLFKDSWKAAGYGGIFGIGYGISHPEITNKAAGSGYNNEGRYIREKGNSFLALVEEAGMVGLVLFILAIGAIISKISIGCFLNPVVYPRPHRMSILSLPVLVSFVFHAQFEGWIVGVSSHFILIALIISISELNE